MATINIVIWPLDAQRFSAGELCALEHAHCLVSRGHRVNVVPILPCPYPRWFKKDIGTFVSPRAGAWFRVLRTLASQAPRFVLAKAFARSGQRRDAARAAVKTAMSEFAWSLPKLFNDEVRLGLACGYLSQAMPAADATVATLFRTVVPTALTGTGRLFFLSQGYDPYFKSGFANPEFAEREAELGYRLGLRLIANSSWLRSRIQELVPGATVALCPNGMDHEFYHGSAKTPSTAKEITVLSYGGYGIEWKGLREMVQAIRIAKDRLPDWRIRWLVFGNTDQFLVPPDNDIAPFEALGFLSHSAIAAAYRQADVLLSASWFESFPMFPIEAMACGLPVVMTQVGAEEYAKHGETAEIVEPRNPESIAAGLCRVVTDLDYRRRLSEGGLRICKEFTWERSGATLEQIVVQGSAGSLSSVAASGK